MLALGGNTRRLTGGIALVALLVSASLPADTVYQWKDANGRTVFSQQPPPDGNATKVPKKAGTPGNAASTRPSPSSAATTPAATSEPAAKPLTAEDEQKLAQACKQAREVLRLLGEKSRPRYLDDQGQRAYMSDEMKAERTADAERKAKEYCRQQ